MNWLFYALLSAVTAALVSIFGKIGLSVCVYSAERIAGALSWLFYFLALKTGKVAQVGAVDKLSVVIAVALAFIFLGERKSPGSTLPASP